MKCWSRCLLTGIAALVIFCSLPIIIAAQERAAVLSGAELARVVPPGFYFQGQSRRPKCVTLLQRVSEPTVA